MAEDIREIKRLVQDLAVMVARHEERLQAGARTFTEIRERLALLEDKDTHMVTTTECRRQHERGTDQWQHWARLVVSAILGAALATGVAMVTR
jgi:hypothetical protein